jgi:FkbM family methyltransferase
VTSAPASASERVLASLNRWGQGRSDGPVLSRALRWASWGGFVSMLVVANPGARGHRVKALARMWAWQVWRRFPGRPILVSFDGGTRLYFPPWSTLAGHVAATGSHEPTEQAFMAHYVRPGDLAVDVGANLGIYTVALAGLGAQVVAFEPGTQARSVLEYNVALNGFGDRVRVVPWALGDRDGEAVLTTTLDGANHLEDAHRGSHATEPVALRTLDSVAGEAPDWFDADGPMVVKIDAEGYDEAVLRGASGLLEKRRPIVMVETWDGGTRIRRRLADLDYRVYSYHPQGRRLVEYPADWSGQANFIAVPDARLEQVNARLAEGRPAPGGLPRVRWGSVVGPAGHP